MGVKAIEIYEKRNVLGNVRDRAPIFTARMEKLKDHPLVGDVRCKGLIGGLEIVADKATKRSFNPKQGVALKCSEFLQNRGAILRPIGDTMALCPPMIVKDDELNALFDRLEKSLDDTESLIEKELSGISGLCFCLFEQETRGRRSRCPGLKPLAASMSGITSVTQAM